MEILYTVLKTLAAIGVMTLIVPLMVWAGTGSFQTATRALREYWLIMGAMVAIVCGVGCLAALADLISPAIQ